MQHRSDFTKTVDYVRNLKTGNHAIFFYRSSHEKHEVLLSFLQAGFQRGEGAIYIATQETPTQIRRRMEDFGLNVKALEKDGALRMFGPEWYISDGEVNMSHTIMLAMRVFDEAMEIGLKGLRTCGEAACFFEHKKEKELVDYELMIGRKLDLPVTAICAYDVNQAKSLEEKFFFSLIKAHGPVVTSSFARELKFENFFAKITDEVLETVFGYIGKESILRMLEEYYSLTPHKLAEDPNSFVQGLEQLIGSGAQVITKSMVRQMHSKIGMTKSQFRQNK